ncbi:MAG: 50S ribosomal protein L18 [Bacteroidota bacterium]
MITKRRVEHRKRLKHHIRLRVTGTSVRPRLTVYKSLRQVYAQIVDDQRGTTLLSVSTLSKAHRDDFKGLKGQVAAGKVVGKLAARLAREHNITEVVFDRNGYLYHGAVKALADGAREGGLKF